MLPDRLDPARVVLQKMRDDAEVLRRAGSGAFGDMLAYFAAEFETAVEPYITWMPESDAMLRSGRRREWLRAKFPAWERDGNAQQLARGHRWYRQCVVPVAAQTSEATLAGIEAARAMKKAS